MKRRNDVITRSCDASGLSRHVWQEDSGRKFMVSCKNKNNIEQDNEEVGLLLTKAMLPVALDALQLDCKRLTNNGHVFVTMKRVKGMFTSLTLGFLWTEKHMCVSLPC